MDRGGRRPDPERSVPNTVRGAGVKVLEGTKNGAKRLRKFGGGVAKGDVTWLACVQPYAKGSARGPGEAA